MSDMKPYIGTKLINAIDMTRAAYNILRGWELPANENGDDPGYLVEYVDGGQANHPNFKGYISWSPKDVFERAYKPLDGAVGTTLTPEQVGAAFRTIMLEENYNFLEDDLVKLANAFVTAAAPSIQREERAKCIEVAKSVNHLVAQKIQQVRGNA